MTLNRLNKKIKKVQKIKIKIKIIKKKNQKKNRLLLVNLAKSLPTQSEYDIK